MDQKKYWTLRSQADTARKAGEQAIFNGRIDQGAALLELASRLDQQAAAM